MAEPLKPNETYVKFCRIGTFYDNKPSHYFKRIEETPIEKKLTEDLFFEITKKNKRPDGVGTVWKIVEIKEPNGDVKWRVGGAEYVGPWHDKDARLTWDAEQEIRDAQRAIVQKAKTAGKDSALREAVKPLRDLYRSQVGSNRQQLLAYIVSEIVK